MTHASLLSTFNQYNTKVKHNRAFTIKTKYSIPEVNFKQPIRSIEVGPLHFKKETNKLRIDISSNSKGVFIRPKIYDVPSLMITNHTSEEQKIIRKKNK